MHVSQGVLFGDPRKTPVTREWHAMTRQKGLFFCNADMFQVGRLVAIPQDQGGSYNKFRVVSCVAGAWLFVWVGSQKGIYNFPRFQKLLINISNSWRTIHGRADPLGWWALKLQKHSWIQNQFEFSSSLAYLAFSLAIMSWAEIWSHRQSLQIWISCW